MFINIRNIKIVKFESQQTQLVGKFKPRACIGKLILREISSNRKVTRRSYEGCTSLHLDTSRLSLCIHSRDTRLECRYAGPGL